MMTIRDAPDSGQLLSISQFSRYSGISRSALIFYDRSGIFHPAKRDPQNNYRYYLPEQIITVNLINVLTELDIPLKHIKKLSAQRSRGDILKLFNDHRATLQEHIDRLENSKKLVDVFNHLLRWAQGADISTVIVETIPVWDIRLGPETNFPAHENFYRPFLDFCSWAKDQGLPVSLPIGGSFSSFERFCKRPGAPSNFFLLMDTDNRSGETCETLVAYTRGFYGQTGDIAERLRTALTNKKVEPAGPVLNIFIEDEISVVDPSQYLMLALLPVRPATAKKEGLSDD
jgi:DNA-binding transcriptional MerR regulator